MALIAQRLGFRIVDQCFSADGKIIDNGKIIVVGQLADVQARIIHFQKTAQRVVSRQKRLQNRLKPLNI